MNKKDFEKIIFLVLAVLKNKRINLSLVSFYFTEKDYEY